MSSQKYKIVSLMILTCFAVAVFVAGALYVQKSSDDTGTTSEKIRNDTKTAISDKANEENIANPFIPHKALYKVNMISSHSGSQLINLSGQMFFKWETTCDAWVTDHRFNLVYEYTDSSPMHISNHFSTYEPFESNNFNFTSRRKRDGKTYEETRGRAETSENGKKVIYSLPEFEEVDLDNNVLFPMAHTFEILDALKKGKKFHTATVFDGSDEEGPVIVSSFIGEKTIVPEDILSYSDVDKELLTSPAYKLRMAFFPVEQQNPEADYEMSVIFHENGIISDMIIEYDDFTVSQKLIALEKLEKPDCM